MSTFPHFLDSRLTGGGEVASLTRRPHFTPRKIPLREAESILGPSAAEGIRSKVN
jgi:hypothetical protein